jgi:hypothetical protein
MAAAACITRRMPGYTVACSTRTIVISDARHNHIKVLTKKFRRYRTSTLIIVTTKTTFDTILKQFNPVHIFTDHFRKIYFKPSWIC